jgi:hypothetical protein
MIYLAVEPLDTRNVAFVHLRRAKGPPSRIGGRPLRAANVVCRVRRHAEPSEALTPRGNDAD